MISDVKPGSVMIMPLNGDVPWIASPGDAMYSTALMVASHHWIKGKWIPVEEIDNQTPTFLSMRDCFAHLNSECHWRSYGVILDDSPVQKWETADSERGYVDVWFRQYQAPGVIRHRLFGKVEFVKL